MRKLLFISLLIAFNFNLNASTTSEPIDPGFDIVKAGVAMAVVVIPACPTADVTLAAEELCSHIEKATKVRLAITTEMVQKKAQMNSIYLGPCQRTAQVGLKPGKLPSNNFYIKVSGNEMFLAGKDKMETGRESRGTLFAVYRWLDTQMGVKWLWPGDIGTVVPQTNDIASGSESQQTIIAPFIHSRLRVGGYGGQSSVSEAANERYLEQTKTWMRRHRMVESVSFNYPEAFAGYWDRFGTTHPEYFALRPDGTRRPYDEHYEWVQMCVSEPGLHKQIVQDWQARIKPEPWMSFINCNENDRRIVEDPSCICDVCKAWDPNPNPLPLSIPPYVSDRYARSWLAVQAEGRKHDPEATVFAYAYMGYVEPPVETMLNDHIIVSIVPQYEYPLPKTDTSFKRLWGGWYKAGASLSLRPNYFLDGYCMPFIFARQFGGEFKFAYEHGLIGTDFDALTGMWGVQGPNLYMVGRIQDKPDMSVDAILDEYYNGFGSASNQVRAYFDYWEQISNKKDEAWKKKNEAGGWSKLSNSGESIYTLESFTQGFALLASASAAAASNPENLQRVKFLEVWLKNAELAMKTLVAYRNYQNNPALLPEVQNAQTTLDAYRVQFADYFSAANWGIINQVEAWAGWRK